MNPTECPECGKRELVYERSTGSFGCGWCGHKEKAVNYYKPGPTAGTVNDVVVAHYKDMVADLVAESPWFQKAIWEAAKKEKLPSPPMAAAMAWTIPVSQYAEFDDHMAYHLALKHSVKNWEYLEYNVFGSPNHVGGDPYAYPVHELAKMQVVCPQSSTDLLWQELHCVIGTPDEKGQTDE